MRPRRQILLKKKTEVSAASGWGRIERSVTSTTFVAQAVKPVLSCLAVREDQDNTGLTACATGKSPTRSQKTGGNPRRRGGQAKELAAWCIALAAASLAYAADDLIVPGFRVGPVTRNSTEQSLLQSLGKAAVKEDVQIGEGMTEPGLVIYKNDPARRLAVVWNDDRPAHPASIFICYGEVDTPCRWHTASGIASGVTLKDLELRNGRPFQMVGWGSDVGGNVVSYEGGKLERELKPVGALGLTLAPRIDKKGEYIPKITSEELGAVQGEKFLLSSHAVLQKLNPHVATMSLEFPRESNFR